MIRKVILTLGIVLIAVSCKQATTQEKEFNAAKDSVMTAHDEMMKDMGTISSLIQKIEPHIDSTKSGSQYKSASIRLERAHDRMMYWMHEFNDEFPNINNDKKDYSANEYTERTIQMRAQKQKLEKLERQINQSITNAEELLEKK